MKRKFSVLVLITVLLLIALSVFAACNEDTVKKISNVVQHKGKLSAPTDFDYNGKFVSWSKVPNATSYVVTLPGGKELSYTSANCMYKNDSGEDFSVTVKAKADNYDDSDAVTVVFSPIGAVTNLTVADDGTLTWNEVDFADSYEVVVNNEAKIVAQATFSDLNPGQNTVSVRAKRSSDDNVVFYSSGVATKTVTICGDVDASRITYKEGTISWPSVQGAKAYELYINDQLEEAEVIGTKYDFDAHNGNFEVAIKAIGDHTATYDGKNTVKRNFLYLEAATGVQIDSGVLVWQPVQGAESYTLKINGIDQSKTFTECKYTGLRAGQETRIQIRANSTDTAYYASWTDEMSFLILAAPEIRWVEGNLDGDIADTIVWDSVPGAAGYSVKLITPDKRSTEKTISSEARAFGNAYMDAGEYVVSVKSNAAQGGNVYDSAYSQEIKVIRLAAPKAASSGYITSYPDSVERGFDVSFTAVTNASGYELWRDDSRVATTNGATTQFARVNDFVDNAVMTEQIYTYRVKSLGSSFNSSKRVKVLDCLSSATLNFDITVLAMPSDPKMKGFNLEFGSVSKASKYTINIGGAFKDSETTSYSLEALASGSYNVSVNARGNNSDILSSNYTVPINIVRLVAPENIKISIEGSEGVLIFDGTENAKSYELVIDGKVYGEITGSNVENMTDLISTSGTQIHLRAVANQYDKSSNTKYFMTSPDSQTKTFTKLPAPTFGDSAFSNTQLIWNAVTIFSDISPRYTVCDESEIDYNGTFNGATMDISYLDGGKSYTFKVKAIGDGIKYINSEYSEQKSVFKLATPDVQINEARDAYIWTGVSNTTSYAVKIDGEVADLQIHNYGDEYTFAPGFKKVKVYQVAVYAKGDGGVKTIDSSPCEIRQEAKQLDTPDFKYSYTSETAGEGKIKMEITKEAPYASGYIYGVGDVYSEKETALSYEFDPNNVGSYSLSLYALGGKFDEKGVYYTDSQRCGGNANYTIILLAQPNYGDIAINRDGVLSWKTISGASSYEITLTIDGVGYSAKNVKQGYTFDIVKEILTPESKKWKDVTKVIVSIVGVGDGEKTVSSKATERTFSDISH